MIDELLIRAARPEDAGSIGRIYRDAVDPWLAEVTALGSPRATAYLRDLVEQDGPGWSSKFWVAECKAGVVGFVQMRRADPTTVFVNNIYVSAAYRGVGGGARLLGAAVGELRRFKTIKLDVFDGNAAARRWYEQLGFEQEARRTWWVGELPRAPTSFETGTDYSVESWPQARAIHQAFGFSMLTIETPDHTYAIGRLGDKWWRIPTPAALRDPCLLAALHRLGPTRHVLLIAPGALEPDLELTRHEASTRLHAPLSEVLDRLVERNET